MKLSQHLIYSAVALGIVVASVALPTVVFGADRYAADVAQTAADFVPTAAGHLEEGMRCNSRQTACTIVTDRLLGEAHIALYTRRICPSANPDIVKVGHQWHARFMCSGVLSEIRFNIVRHVK